MLSFERESSLVAELATPILIEGYWVPFFEEIGELKAAAKVAEEANSCSDDGAAGLAGANRGATIPSGC